MEHPNRRSIRLKGYDYSQAGAYFVTICTQGRCCHFGDIADGRMRLNAPGEMVLSEWHAIPDRFPSVESDMCVLMPNHFHAILLIVTDGTRAGSSAGQSAGPKLGAIIGAFKSITTNAYVRGVRQSNWPRFDDHLWQRNFYEHIIRNPEELLRLQEYVVGNPQRWMEDQLFQPRP